MKKLIALFLVMGFVGMCRPAFAMTPEEEKKAHFDAMKAVKEKQRAERETEKKNDSSKPSGPHEKSFWEKEGERSGLGGSGNRMGNIFKNLNPVPFFKDQEERYKARKAGTAAPQK